MTQPPQAQRSRRTYRQRSAVVLGLIFSVGLVAIAISDFTSGGFRLGLALLALAPLVAAILVWPSVVLDHRGVLIRNIVTDTVIPWRLVDDCSMRWNLEVWTHTKGYTAWAISAARRGSMPEHHMMMAGLNPAAIGRPSKVEEHAQAAADRHNRQVHAASVAQAIETAKKEYDGLVREGALPDGGDTVQRTVSPVPVTLLVLAAVAAAVFGISYL